MKCFPVGNSLPCRPAIHSASLRQDVRWPPWPRGPKNWVRSRCQWSLSKASTCRKLQWQRGTWLPSYGARVHVAAQRLRVTAASRPSVRGFCSTHARSTHARIHSCAFWSGARASARCSVCMRCLFRAHRRWPCWVRAATRAIARLTACAGPCCVTDAGILPHNSQVWRPGVHLRRRENELCFGALHQLCVCQPAAARGNQQGCLRGRQHHGAWHCVASPARELASS